MSLASRAKRLKMKARFNLNDYALVRLTVSGEKTWSEYWKRTEPSGVPECIRKSHTQPDGRVRFQIHELMHVFGSKCFNGSIELPFEKNSVVFIES